MVGSEFVSEAEDAVRVGFGGVEVVVGVFEGGEVLDRKVFGELFDREAGKIIGHSIVSWGFIQGVFIRDRDGAD